MRIFVYSADKAAGMRMQQIEIHTGGRAVSRIVGAVSFAEVVGLLSGEREIYLVYDRNVAWVAEAVEAALSGDAPAGPSACGGEGKPVLRGRRALIATEEGKDLASVTDICNWLLEAGASRNALLVAIGGGITTDLAGFAASIYKRGIRYANIPTTLLGQVDAGIGGKTGVNFRDYKNMLGVIVQPDFTFICAETLRTLPPRDILSGVAELLKTFLIEDRDGGYARAVRLFSSRKWGENGDEPGRELQALVFAAAAVKAGVVGRDPFEHGERRRLNLGHTFAHAIEHNARLAGDDITHGEAVAMGIILAARLADRLETKLEKPWCAECPDRADCHDLADAAGTGGGMEARLCGDFAAAGLPVECPYPLAMLAGAMEKDKKAAGGKVRFQIPVAIGRVREVELTVAEAMGLLENE